MKLTLTGSGSLEHLSASAGSSAARRHPGLLKKAWPLVGGGVC